MIEFTIETRIERPADEVFAFATDPANLERWQTNTVSAVREDEGPIGVGSRFREVHGAPGGKEVPSLVEVSEYEPGRVFSLRVIEGVPVHLRMTFEPDGEATVLRFASQGQLTGALRLIQPLLGRQLQRQFTKDCARLKQELESGGQLLETAA